MSWIESCVVPREEVLDLGPKEADRISSVLPMIENASERHGVSVDLLCGLIWVESRFNPNAKSSAGAMGLCQIMPSTFRFIQESQGLSPSSNPFDPETNINAGAWFLSRLIHRYDGNVTLALAAYNAGPGNVAKYKGIPPFTQTRAYVQSVPRASENFRIARMERCQGYETQKMSWANRRQKTKSRPGSKLSPRPSSTIPRDSKDGWIFPVLLVAFVAISMGGLRW